MAERDCPHSNVAECGELVCRDCGLVLGPIFRHPSTSAAGRSWVPPPTAECGSNPTSSRSDERLRDGIANALARLFLDSDGLIEEAVSVWKRISRHRSTETSSGRRRLAYVLWDTLASKDIIREKEDIETACGASPGDISAAERREGRKKTRDFHPPSEQIDVLGSWLNIPYRHRRAVSSYMRTFEFENRYLSRKPETLAAASLLYVCSRIKKDRGRPDYMRNVTPSSVAELIDVDRGELRGAYDMLQKAGRERRRKNIKGASLRKVWGERAGERGQSHGQDLQEEVPQAAQEEGGEEAEEKEPQEEV